MTANSSDFFKKVGTSTVTTLSAPGKALGATSINVGSTTGYPTDTGVVISIRTVDTSGKLIAGTHTEWSGTVTSGTSCAIEATPVYGSDQIYAAGSATQVSIRLSSYAHNKLIDGLLVQHTQTGAHHDITSTNATITNATIANLTIGSQAPSADWTTIATPPNTVTYNGQRSYTMVWNGVDYTNILSPGQRIKTTRTVAAPTQCTSLNGTTQYWVKTSPNKLTFTDDFVVDAYVKVTSYAAGAIASRFNGTSGWNMEMGADGSIWLVGWNNGAANNSYVKSYQSLPLNKWVRITAQLDMSAFTSTVGAEGVRSWIMIDGVEVSASVARGGTNPTALIQAGNLEIGSRNGGLYLFPGKIAQVAIYNAKVTQANIRLTHSQGLTGSETSLASAYSFDGVATDLNTTTPNDLTAQGSATATNADSPFGTQASGLISSTLDYGIVQSATFSTNTTVVVQVPEGCTIPTSGGLSAVAYSGLKAPYGFPTQKEKWSILSQNLTLITRITPGAGIWYNDGGILTVPVGNWEMYYGGCLELNHNSTQNYITNGTLSTSNNTSGGNETLIGGFTPTALNLITVSSVTSYATFYKSFAAQTTMYFNISTSGTPTNIYLNGTLSPTIIEATNAYL